MNDKKRIWIVAVTITSEDGYISTSQHLDENERDARDRLAAFKQRCIKDGDSHVPSYALQVSGKIMKENPDFDKGNTEPKLIPTGGYYCGVMTKFDFDPDTLEDAEREYEVDVRVIRYDSFSVMVTADSEDDAEEKAKERINDGDEDAELEYPDDMEIEIDSVCEA